MNLDVSLLRKSINFFKKITNTDWKNIWSEFTATFERLWKKKSKTFLDPCMFLAFLISVEKKSIHNKTTANAWSKAANQYVTKHLPLNIFEYVTISMTHVSSFKSELIKQNNKIRTSIRQIKARHPLSFYSALRELSAWRVETRGPRAQNHNAATSWVN